MPLLPGRRIPSLQGSQTIIVRTEPRPLVEGFVAVDERDYAGSVASCSPR